MLAIALLLPACSNDTDVLGPQTPPVRMDKVMNDHDLPVGPEDDVKGRLGRYAMAAS